MNMQKDRAKYSIVIPTRNREEYISYAIQSVLSNERLDIELIVSNNHSSDGTARYLSTLSDPRLRVVMPKVELPMSSHYEFALSQATGEWVTIVGDDDAVMPFIFERLDTLIRKHPDISVISSARAYYFWPGCEDLYGNRVVDYRPGASEQVRSTKHDLRLALAGLRSCFDMPQIYTTCIARNQTVQRVRQHSGGHFYHSIIPDMYSVVALTCAESTYLRIDDPLFWTGTSNKSLGRSDRIYQDTKLSAPSTKLGAFQGPSGLHPRVSQSLHVLGFESYYLYECLLQSPLSPATWRGKSTASLVYASLLMNSHTVSKSRGVALQELQEAILAEVAEAGLSTSRIRGVVIFLHAAHTMQWLLQMPSKLYRKAQRMRRNDRIVSSNRSLFPTILDASKAVAGARNSQ